MNLVNVVLTALEENGFELDAVGTGGGKRKSTHTTPKRKFFEGSFGTLRARVRGFGDSVYVTFSGTGVNKERESHITELADIKTFVGRIKRVVRAAQQYTDKRNVANEAQDAKFEKIASKLREYNYKFEQTFNGNARVLVNGHAVTINADMVTRLELGSFRDRIAFEKAIEILNILPSGSEKLGDD